MSRATQASPEETTQTVTSSSEAIIDELAHELRQPLGTIEHLAYLLRMDATDCKVVTYVEQIQDQIEQANQVLDKARAGLPCTSI